MGSVVLGLECNNDCVFCSIDSIKPKGGLKKTKPEILRLIDKAAEADSSMMEFTGGEPTIRSDLPELIAYASKKCRKIWIDTNGRRLKDKAFLKKMVLSGANIFGVTLLGTTAKIHDSLTRKKGSFSDTVKGLKNISSLKKKHSIRLVLEFILAKQNMRELKKLDSFAKKFKADSIIIIHVKPMGRAKKNFLELHPPYSESCREIEKAVFSVPFSIFNIPPCVLGRDKRKHLKLPANSQLFYSKGKTFVIVDEYNLLSTKAPNCQECAFCPVCPGVWQEYAKNYGLGEFKPLRAK
ncbi:MAG: radical SAM protein [Candidatus Diapherotrites archaeon]